MHRDNRERSLYPDQAGDFGLICAEYTQLLSIAELRRWPNEL